MQNIITFIKNYWLFIVLAAIAFLLFSIYIFVPKEEQPQPPATPQPQTQSWKLIAPGKTTTQDVIQQLGQPITIKQEQNYKVFEYPTESEALKDEVFITSDTVGLVKEKVVNDNKGLSSYINQFGEPEKILYGPYASVGIALHLFTKNGIAVLAHPEQGLVFEVWYFVPTTTEEFIASWGQNLSETLPEQL